MKSIMLSIKPQYVCSILNNTKILEIRKKKPKCKLPCKVYIYETKDKFLIGEHFERSKSKENLYLGGKAKYTIKKDYYFGKGKVVAEFTLKQVEKIIYLTDRESVKKHGCWECKLEDKWKIENGFNKGQFNPEDYSNYYIEGSDDNYLIFYSRLTGTELHNYLKGQTGYAWQIDDLKIYDKPKELSEFSSIMKRMKGKESRLTSHLLQKPPQSYCFVQELKEN